MFTCILTITPPHHNSIDLFKAGRYKIDAYCVCGCLCVRITALLSLHISVINCTVTEWTVLAPEAMPDSSIQITLPERKTLALCSQSNTTHTQINTAAHFFGENTNMVMHPKHGRGYFIYSCSWYTSCSEGCGTDSIIHEPAEEVVMHGDGCYLKISIQKGQNDTYG